MRKHLIVLFVCALATLCVKGQSLHVQTISVLGNEKTKPEIILRELSFQEGDSIEVDQLDELLERNRQNVYNLRLFNKVVLSHEELQGNIYIIIEVKERWYIFPIPHFRIEERNSYDLVTAIRERNFERLVYGLQLQWRNVTGRNELLSFYGQLGYSKRLYVDFFRPFIFPKKRIDLWSGVHHTNVREIIYGTIDGRLQRAAIESEPLRKSFRAYIGLRKRFTPYESLYTELTYQSYQFADSIYAFGLEGDPSNFIPSRDGREQYPSFTAQYVKDLRDLRTFPLNGWKYQFFFRAAGNIGGGPQSTRFLKIGGTWSHYIPISKRWNFGYGTHHVASVGKYIPFFEKNFIGLGRREFSGISKTLRGYQSYLIDGSYVQMTKAELKFAVIPRKIVHLKEIPLKWFRDFPLGVYLTAFTDFGYVSDNFFNNQDQFLKNKLLTGYGLGLNFISFYDTLLRVEWARNHLGQNGVFLHTSVQIK